MSRRRKSPTAPPESAESLPGIPSAATASFSSGTGFTAADQSDMRGQVWFPNTDSERVLTGYARTTILAKARWLEANMGLGRHFANTIPMLVGPLLPQARTKDQKWNDEAEAFFLRTQGSAMVHDMAGAEGFFDRQRTVTKRGLVDGDGLMIRTTTSTGNARTILYEGPQIGNRNYNQKDGWHDGVKLDKFGRKVRYSLCDPRDRNSFVEIDASKVMHFGNFESPRAARGLSAFVHAINRLLDIREMDNDTIRGIKAANLVGFFLTNQSLSNIDAAPAAGRFQTRAFNGIAPSNVASPAPVTFEQLSEGGGNVMTLNQGQDLKTVNDARRHPNQQAVIDYFVSDCAWGFGFPPNSLWSIAGLTGPAVRFVMRMAEKSLGVYRNKLRNQFCQPYWVYSLALAQRNGDIPWCKDPDWWKCDWIAPSALTIDAGRDSASGIKELQAGAQTMADWYGEDSRDWQESLEQIAKERAYVMNLEKQYSLEPGTILGERDIHIQEANAAKNQNTPQNTPSSE